MMQKEKNFNWGVTDYCKNLHADQVASLLSLYGTGILECKPFLSAIKCTEQDGKLIHQFQNQKLIRLGNMIVGSTEKLTAFKSLLEQSYLRASFPQQLEYDLGLPKTVPHRLVPLPQTRKAFNLRILVQMFNQVFQSDAIQYLDDDVSRMLGI